MYESVRDHQFNLMWSGESQLLAKPSCTAYVRRSVVILTKQTQIPLKEKFTKKEKICLNVLTFRPSKMCEFVSSSEQIWRNVSFHHLLKNGSSAVNGCRQNENPNR